MGRSFGRLLLAAVPLFVIAVCLQTAQAQITGVTATANNIVNIRAGTGVDFDLVGEMEEGTAYPVLARSEFYPWLLIGDPVTMQPIGWIYEEIVAVSGTTNNLPLSDDIIDPSNTAPTQAPAVTPTVATAPTQSAATQSTVVTVDASGSPVPTLTATATVPQPTATFAYNIAGIVQGEINVRYGPGVQYPRVGVAQAGERFEITGYHTQQPWVQIRYPDSPTGFAWIAIDLLEIQGDIYQTDAISDISLRLPTLTPTPSVISSGNDGSDISPEFAALGEQLAQIMLSGGFDLATSRFGALFLMDLQTGEAITLGSDYAFSGTSITKVAILARLYETLTEPPGVQLATDIANTMICSENAATNRLLSTIGEGDEWRGAAAVTEMYQQLGLTNSFIVAPYTLDPNNPPLPSGPLDIPDTTADSIKSNADYSNQLTVDDMGHLLADVYQCAYDDQPMLDGAIEPRECRQMLHVMSNNTVDALLRAGVPEEIRVAHKHGWIPDTHGNAAVFFTPGGDYVMVMMLHQPDWLNYDESLPVLAEASRTVYNYFNPDEPMDAIREGYIPDALTCNFAGTPLITDLRQPVWDD
ncbi:serine hydrolase [Phototrophicus methaneseepsis]|uniref:Serine hydrolase n=1 Tax=Phototrophicus methaneseepsis TaxID=2710758 RepID=A0A7S8E6Z7_9CHLR|nr:serine hydrolase [Phototrophicus methaneseepsis]QPC81520.1 serine hydrolase [Phototrophicus methaneseepsis]